MKKVFKNVIASVFPQLVNIITNLILPGLIIAQFGSEINGLVSTTKTVVSYISLVGAGIATAVTQALYQPVANQDHIAVKGMLKSANGMFNRYGMVYLVITLIIALAYPFAIRSDIPYATVMLLLIVMSISGASEFFAIGRSRALLYAHQKVYVCSIVQAISLLLSLGLALLMLYLNVGIIMVQFAISFVYVLRGFILTAYIRKTYPQYVDYKSAPPLPTAIEKRKDAMIHQLAGLVVTGSQSAILTLLVDLRAASIYSVYNIVLYGIRNICSNLCTAIIPFLGKRYALNQKDELKKLYNVVELVFFFGVTFVLMVTVALLIPFVSLYTKGADINYIYPIFALLFVVSSFFYIIKLPGTALINVAGHFKETKGRALTEAGLCMVFSIVFTLFFGKDGVLLGTALALGWRCIDTVIYSSKYILGASSGRSIARITLAFVNILAVGFVSGRIEHIVNSWMEWVLLAIAYSAVSIVILALEVVLLERSSLKQVVSFFKKPQSKNSI